MLDLLLDLSSQVYTSPELTKGSEGSLKSPNSDRLVKIYLDMKSSGQEKLSVFIY